MWEDTSGLDHWLGAHTGTRRKFRKHSAPGPAKHREHESWINMPVNAASLWCHASAHGRHQLHVCKHESQTPSITKEKLSQQTRQSVGFHLAKTIKYERKEITADVPKSQLNSSLQKTGQKTEERWLLDAYFIGISYYSKGVDRERERCLLLYYLSVSSSETLFIIASNTLSEKLLTFALQM